MNFPWQKWATDHTIIVDPLSAGIVASKLAHRRHHFKQRLPGVSGWDPVFSAIIMYSVLVPADVRHTPLAVAVEILCPFFYPHSLFCCSLLFRHFSLYCIINVASSDKKETSLFRIISQPRLIVTLPGTILGHVLLPYRKRYENSDRFVINR